MSDLKFKSKFTGLVQLKDLNKISNIGYTKDFNWFYIRLSEIQELKSDFNILEKRVGAFWYKESLDVTAKKNNWFIPKDEATVFTGQLKDVLLCDFNRNQKNQIQVIAIEKDKFEVTGICYFSVHKPTNPLIQSEQTTNISAPSPRSVGNGWNILNVNLGSSSEVNRIKSKKSNWSSLIQRVSDSSSSPSKSIDNPNHSSNRGGCFSRILRGIFKILGWLWLFTVSFTLGMSIIQFWNVDRSIAYVLLGMGFIWFFFRYKKWNWFAGITSILIFLLLAGIYDERAGSLVPDNRKKTQSGNIKTTPPKKTSRTDENGNKIQDQLHEKNISWFDFIDNKHSVVYGTYSSDFINSRVSRESCVSNLNGYKDPVKYFNRIYSKAVEVDNQKLDSIVKKIQNDVKKYDYSQLDIARSVVTMIQEIPYVLVHDKTCKEVIRQDQGFSAEYHQEGKPCLPSIKGGVQTPYEFIHNLKGDCDTRSLLGHLILRKLGIPSSIWVSMAYGHSILGVGLPVGVGQYKKVNGVKHYAVELTAKGFDLGMISPEQTQMNNWDIALYN